MILPEQKVKIRYLFFAEHWRVGTIAADLNIHPTTVRSVIEANQFGRGPSLIRVRMVDPYMEYIQETLKEHPRLRATRIFEMVRDRGYLGSVVQLRRAIRVIRPTKREAFLRLTTFAGEQAQADWAYFDEINIGKAKRRLSCFVITLSYSRALYFEFFLDQGLENLLLGLVHAFEDWDGVPGTILFDNLRSVVLDRFGDHIQFHPRILEMAGHYHCLPRPCQVRRGNEKGRVERVIQYIRHSFYPLRRWKTVEELNEQARKWTEEVAHQRRWPEDDSRTVAEVFQEEKSRLLPLPQHRFETDLIRPVRSGKTIYVRFDLNDYSIPPDAVGKQLTLVASPTRVRLLDGSLEIASHQRSYDRHNRVEDPAHIDAVLKEKRKALGSSAIARLQHAIPNIREFLELAFQRGEPLGRMTKQLILLLKEYGAAELCAAITETIQRQTPRISSVAYLLNQRHRSARMRKLQPVDMSRHPHLADVSVPTHKLEVYDELTKDDSEN